jgi:hypothetical protein
MTEEYGDAWVAAAIRCYEIALAKQQEGKEDRLAIERMMGEGGRDVSD